MDTRDKILTPAEFERRRAEFSGALTVRAYLDPLLAWHARRLRELDTGAGLVIVLADPPDPLLDSRARAELAASLSMVRCVVLPPPGDKPAADAQVSELHADMARRDRLADHVRNRHGRDRDTQ